MKKRYIALIGVYVIIVVLIYNYTKNNNDDTSKTSVYDTSEASLNDKFEAPHISEQVSMDFVLGNYDKVRDAAKEIHENYPGSYDERYVQEFINKIEEKEREEEQAVADIDFKNYIQLLSVKTDEPNSAGGVNLYIVWKNTSDKTVKYAHFTCDLYNAVDDKVADTITRSYSRTGTVTGPIDPGTVYGKNYLWENLWWNNSGKYAKITEIRLEYMDGTEIKIPQGRIDELFY